MKPDADFVASVVEHMNTDHADACLCIVQAYGAMPNASKARLTSFDSVALHFSVTANGNRVTAHVPLHKPLTHEQQIRGMLVAMTKRARQELAER